ncbi:uncharacterized protein PRCAT00002540001 [Priceomyces carsonii]|uniref:uncharacterized protein n=1 Tax=Priceomyces carsonii TaxID=28549 RepID=UPI002EDA004B|nr:unnamed protein product [Priceomyces carsonii]
MMGKIPAAAGASNLRKRKTVADKQRKRAVYSCDRCKARKIRCQRLEFNQLKFDDKTPCLQCKSAGVNCTTQAPRKKRTYYSISESSRYQLKCLKLIMKRLYPGRDPDNLHTLSEIAESLDISLPEWNKDIESKDKLSSDSEGFESDEDWQPSQSINDQDNVKMNENSNENANNTAQDYGLEGTQGLLRALLGLTADTQEESSREFSDTLSKEERDLNNLNALDSNESISTSIELLNLRRFPMVELISEADAIYYTDVFFNEIHPGYFVLNESKFRHQQSVFFKELKAEETPLTAHLVNSSNLSNEEICCLYMVWILGQKCCYSADDNNFSNNLLNICLGIVKLLLGDIAVSPSLNGIRLLYVTALYYESKQMRENSWLLFALASQQCVSLGYHRKSAVAKYPQDIQDEIKIVWWSIFRIQMSMNSSLGKVSIISIEAVDVDLPKLSMVSDDLFRDYFSTSVGLFKIMYKILRLRKNLFISKRPLANENIEKMVEIKTLLNKWYDGLSTELKDYESTKPIKRYQIKLHLQFHYLYISLTLPYLLHLSRNIKAIDFNKFEPLLNTICYGIRSAEIVCGVINYSDKSGHFNGLLHYDMFYGYNALMVLISCFTLASGKSGKYSFLENCTIFRDLLQLQFGITPQSNLSAMRLIWQVNEKNSGILKGLMKEASNNIRLLVLRFGLQNIIENDSSEWDEEEDYIPLSPSNAIIYNFDLKSSSINKEGEYETTNHSNAFQSSFSDFEPFNIAFDSNYFFNSNYSAFFTDLGYREDDENMN